MESIIWNKYSKTITQDVSQPAAQAMLYAIGMTEADMKKAQVGIVSMGWEGNPCNMHLNDLAKVIKQGVQVHPNLYGLISILLELVMAYQWELQACDIPYQVEI